MLKVTRGLRCTLAAVQTSALWTMRNNTNPNISVVVVVSQVTLNETWSVAHGKVLPSPEIQIKPIKYGPSHSSRTVDNMAVVCLETCTDWLHICPFQFPNPLSLWHPFIKFQTVCSLDQGPGLHSILCTMSCALMVLLLLIIITYSLQC